MKRLVLILLFSIPLWGQAGTTVVTAVVQDTNGTLYANCSWSAVFVGENTTPGAGPYAPAAYLNGQQGNCDSKGNLGPINLGDNINTITPTPSQWSFSICSGTGYIAGPYCIASVLITISGATQDISATLTSVLPILPTPGGGGGGGGGTGLQFQSAYYNPGNTLVAYGPGLAGQVSTSTGPASPPAFTSSGIPGRTVSVGTTDSILCDSGTAVQDRMRVIYLNTHGSVTETVPDAGTSGCGNNFTFALVIGNGTTAIVNRTTASTFTIFNGATQTSAATLTLTGGQYATFNSPDNANYQVRISSSGGGTTGYTLVTPDFNFSACPSGCAFSISPTTIAAGANTVTLSPVPTGVNGTDQTHFIQINGTGSGAPTEYALITGGTAVGGAASGTITFTAAYTHTSAVSLASATTGIQEAVFSLPYPIQFPGTTIRLMSNGSYSCNAPIFLVGGNTVFDGQGATITHNSFSSCLVGGSTSTWMPFYSLIGHESQNVFNINFTAGVSPWSVTPTGTIPGSSPTATLTIPTCPAGFYPFPNQLLWLAGTNNGVPTTYYGYGEWVVTTGGSCTPGASNGTISIIQASPSGAVYGLGTVNLFAHGTGFTLSNAVGPYVEDAIGDAFHIHDVRWTSNADTTLRGGNMIQIDADQHADIDSINANTGFNTRNDIDFQSACVYSPGPDNPNAAIAYISKMDCTNPAHCINWFSGNDLTWDSGVCQNYNGGAVIIGLKRGGFGKFTIGKGVHFEVGAVAPIMGVTGGLGNPAVQVLGANNPVVVDSAEATTYGSNGSAYPLFVDNGGTLQAYYLVVHNNTLTGCTVTDCVTPPLFIGVSTTTDPSANNVPVSWFGFGDNIANGQVSSYDILRVAQVTANIYPPVPLTAGALIKVTSGLTPATACNIHNVCSFTDNVAPGALAAYTVKYKYGTSNGPWWEPTSFLRPGGVVIGGYTNVGANPTTPTTMLGVSTCIMSDFPFGGGNAGPEFVASVVGRTLGNQIDPNAGGCPFGVSPISAPGARFYCSNAAASPDCTNSNNGTVVIAAGATTVTVKSSAIQLWSHIRVWEDMTQGANLGVTCNTTQGRTYTPTAIVLGTSVTFTASGAPTTNPACLDFFIDNEH